MFANLFVSILITILVPSPGLNLPDVRTYRPVFGNSNINDVSNNWWGGYDSSSLNSSIWQFEFDSCANVVPQVDAWLSNEMNYDVAFDTMKWYLSHCYQTADPEHAFVDFNSTFGHAEQTQTEFGRLDLRQWLMGIRFLSKTDGWYCWCVNTIAGTYTDLRAWRAILQFLIHNRRCSSYSDIFSRNYGNITHSQYITWADTVQDPNHAVFDSSIPSLHDLGLDSLLKDPMSAVHSRNEEIDISNLVVTPNPTNEAAVLNFTTSKEAYVKVDLFDLLGKAVPVVGFENVIGPGNHRVPISLHNLPSGTYYARLQTTYGEVETVKIVKQ